MTTLHIIYLWLADDDEDNDDMTTHGDSSPDPGEEHYTDPLIGEGSAKDEETVL